MFDQILQMVKEHMGTTPETATVIPAEQADAIHQEIASHIHEGLQQPAAAQGGAAGILSQFENSLASGNLTSSVIAGGLVSSLASKFGLPPAATGAIAAALPGLMQKFLSKNSTNPAPAVS
jgi:hypothetical protein